MTLYKTSLCFAIVFSSLFLEPAQLLATAGSRPRDPHGQGAFWAGGFTGGMCSSWGIPLHGLRPNLSRYPMCTSPLPRPRSFTAGKESLEVFTWIFQRHSSGCFHIVALLVGIALTGCLKRPRRKHEEERSVHKYLPKTNVQFSASLQLLKLLRRRLVREISARGREGTSPALPAGPTLRTLLRKHQIFTRCRALELRAGGYFLKKPTNNS